MGADTDGFPPDVRAQIEGVLDHVNTNHPDTVGFVARRLGESAGVVPVEAEITDVTPAGATFTARTANGTTSLRLPFATSAHTAHDVQHELLEALAAARGADPTAPLTSLERDLQATAATPVRFGRFERSRALTPNLVEVTLSGLGDVPVLGGDEFSYVLVRPDGSPFPPGWSMDDYRADHGGDPSVVGAYYTTRRSRPHLGELDLWVVLHDHPNGVAAWMRHATPGAPVAVWGPRRSFHVPDDARHLLLVADETGLASVAALLADLPAAVAVTAVLETVDASHEPELPNRPCSTVRWVHRGTDAPGAGANRLLEAVRAVTAPAPPDVAFGAAESRQISAVRRFVRADLGLPTARVLMTGYWRRVAE